MKTIILLALFATLVVFNSAGQDQKKLFAIHEDMVIPSQDARYAEALKNLKAACLEHQVDISWRTLRHDDNSYIHLTPITSFADLDNDYAVELKKKMGAEPYAKLMSGFDGCYDMHSDYVVEQMADYSYLAPAEGENYRDIMYWAVLSGKESEAEKIMMEWKKLYEGKQVPNGFLSYKVVFGRSPGYAIVSWGKDAVDLTTKDKKTMDMVGKESDELWKRTMAITKQISSKRAWVLPEYSIMPEAATAAKK